MDIKSVPPPMGMSEQKRRRRQTIFGFWPQSQSQRSNVLKSRKGK